MPRHQVSPHGPPILCRHIAKGAVVVSVSVTITAPVGHLVALAEHELALEVFNESQKMFATQVASDLREIHSLKLTTHRALPDCARLESVLLQ